MVVDRALKTHQCAGDVDAAIADGRVVKPFWLGEAEEAVVRDVHGWGWREVLRGWAGESCSLMTMDVGEMLYRDI